MKSLAIQFTILTLACFILPLSEAQCEGKGEVATKINKHAKASPLDAKPNRFWWPDQLDLSLIHI